MTPNMQKITAAKRLISYMAKLISTYENEKLEGPTGEGESFEKDLTPGEISSLKQRFVTARLACKALLDAITG